MFGFKKRKRVDEIRSGERAEDGSTWMQKYMELADHVGRLYDMLRQLTSESNSRFDETGRQLAELNGGQKQARTERHGLTQKIRGLERKIEVTDSSTRKHIAEQEEKRDDQLKNLNNRIWALEVQPSEAGVRLKAAQSEQAESTGETIDAAWPAALGASEEHARRQALEELNSLKQRAARLEETVKQLENRLGHMSTAGTKRGNHRVDEQQKLIDELMGRASKTEDRLANIERIKEVADSANHAGMFYSGAIAGLRSRLDNAEKRQAGQAQAISKLTDAIETACTSSGLCPSSIKNAVDEARRLIQ